MGSSDERGEGAGNGSSVYIQDEVNGGNWREEDDAREREDDEEPAEDDGEAEDDK